MNLIRNFPYFFALALIVLCSSAFADEKSAPEPYRQEFTSDGRAIDFYQHDEKDKDFKVSGQQGTLRGQVKNDKTPTVRPMTREELVSELDRAKEDHAKLEEKAKQIKGKQEKFIKALESLNQSLPTRKEHANVITKADLVAIGVLKKAGDDGKPIAQEFALSIIKRYKDGLVLRTKHSLEALSAQDSVNQKKIAAYPGLIKKRDEEAAAAAKKAKEAKPASTNLTAQAAAALTNPAPKLVVSAPASAAPAKNQNIAQPLSSTMVISNLVSDLSIDLKSYEAKDAASTNSATTKK